jgi:hypothetical protein
MIEGYTDRPTDTPLIDFDRIENDASNSSPTFECIRCLGNVLSEPLPSNDSGEYTHTHRHTD